VETKEPSMLENVIAMKTSMKNLLVYAMVIIIKIKILKIAIPHVRPVVHR
jgi:hypothetical protein